MPNKVEKEWPSIKAIPGLDQDVSDESAGVDEEPVAEELVPSKVEEEWPSIKAIPDMDISKPKSQFARDKSKSQSRTEDDDSSPLGELRFQDE